MPDLTPQPSPELRALDDNELFGTGVDWELPAPGQVLIWPEGDALAGLLRQATTGAAGPAFEVGGVDAGRLRQLARQEALQAAVAFARRFGLWDATPPDPACLVVSGHQPLLVGPGVWLKHALLDVLARRYPAVVSLNVVVDHDTAPAYGAWLPWRGPAGRLERRFLRLGSLRYGQPFCQAPAPDEAVRDGFRGAVREALASLGTPGRGLVDCFEAFWGVAARWAGGSAHLAEWATVARHAWEQSSQPSVRYLELPMGALASGEAFARFFAHLALDARRFATLYNGVLARYRRWRRIRSLANPFPDLAVRDQRVELPFWVLEPGQRRRALHVEPAPGALRLFTADGPLATIPLPGDVPPRGEPRREDAEAVVAFVRRQGLRIRPRAAALTLFLRLWVADVFVHGVGGARYDRVTDALSRLYWGVLPAPYAVASMSLPLPAVADALPPVPEPGQLRHRLRELRFNPQRYVGLLPPGSERAERARALAAEKQRLIEAFGQPGAPRRALTARIQQVNAALFELLQDEARKMEACLRQAEELAAERQAGLFRDYPFFLYEREPVWRAAEAAAETSRHDGRRAALRPPDS